MSIENIDESKIVYDEESNISDSKIERYQINTFTQDRAIETLLKWYNNGKLILPEFQRDYVWTYANSCRLIESILLNLPIPNIFLFKIKDKNGERFLLIDGLQRITTISQYVNGVWRQGETERRFKLQSPNEKWNKRLFKELSEDDKQFLYDYPIGTTIFESSNGDEVDQSNVIFSVFERINTGSEKLSDQEIRNAVYSGELLDTLKETSKNSDYLRLLQNDSSMFKRGKEIEFILRLITYKHIYDQAIQNKTNLIDKKESPITTSKKLMLNNYMFWSNKGLIDYKKDLNDILEAISYIANFDDSAFCGKSRTSNDIGTKVHEVFAEALVLAVIHNDFEISITKESFINQKISIWSDENLIEPFKYKTTDPNVLVSRVDEVLRIIKD